MGSIPDYDHEIETAHGVRYEARLDCTLSNEKRLESWKWFRTRTEATD